ncbi:transcriptional regulator [Methylobacterium sp. DM1]|nr:transcriptional regulator [Methylobacterium sp. DM1]
MIDPTQIRAARAILGWTMEDLSGKAGVSLASIKNIERGVTDPRASTLRAIQGALEDGGVIFLDAGDVRPGGKGVRLK